MMLAALGDADYRRALDGGLVLRWSTGADTERLVDLYSDVFRERADEPPNALIGAWTRDMLGGRHPLIGPGDFALVADSERGLIVAATALMAQTWEYGGIAFPVGRPEVVATRPDYRRRGLIRAIIGLIHARSATRGDLALGITGIAYYYRQFGYEYALDLGGSRVLPMAAVPPLKAGATEPYTLRPATADDLPTVAALYDRERASAVISTPTDAAYWRYNFDGMDPASGEGRDVHLLVDAGGQTVGAVLTGRRRWEDGALPVVAVLPAPETSLVALLPSLLRALRDLAARVPPGAWHGVPEPAPAASGIRFVLGRSHPIYSLLGERWAPPASRPYAWYVRVPDLLALVRHLAPALERRLAASAAAGYSGELRITFFRGGLRLAFDGGRLVAAEDWQAPDEPAPVAQADRQRQASFPPLVFLQLLFGHRSLAELRHAFPDVSATDEATPLLEALFPPAAPGSYRSTEYGVLSAELANKAAGPGRMS